MEKSWTKRAEVRSVAEMLRDNDATARCENPTNLGEERAPRVFGAQLVRREQQEHGVHGARARGKSAKADALRLDRIARQTPRPADRRFRHLDGVEDVERAPVGMREHRPQ